MYVILNIYYIVWRHVQEISGDVTNAKCGGKLLPVPKRHTEKVRISVVFPLFLFFYFSFFFFYFFTNQKRKVVTLK